VWNANARNRLYKVEDDAIGRTDELFMPILKRFDERLTSAVMQRFPGFIAEGNLGLTVIGEPIQRLCTRLSTRQERGKVLFVLTDGQPFGHWGNFRTGNRFSRHAKDVIKDVENSGTIDIIGIGIEYDLSGYFSRGIVIDNLSQLPSVLMAELRSSVIGKVHR
jgi:cobalamin biosynthesis protein CobT